MNSAANWVGESTSAFGSDDFVLDGPLEGYASFVNYPNGPYWYTIIEGNNKECGFATIAYPNFTRITVHATLVDGIFSSTGLPMSLNGQAQVFVTFNKESYDEFVNHTIDSSIHFSDAPPDGQIYGRQMGNWVPVTGVGSGEANTTSNAGPGAGLVLPKVGVNLPFKSLVAGANISLVPTADSIEIIGVAGTGEANTTSNAGSGIGLALAKSGVNLPFKSLVAGANITLTPTADSVTIESTATSGVTSVAGEVGTITKAELLTAINVEDGADVTHYGFRYLADGEPILIVCIGDSNAAGSSDINTSLVSSNSSVFYYALATSGETYNIANLGWRNLDPNSTLRGTQQNQAAAGGVTMTGQLLGGSNSVDMMTAYALEEQTGRQVYVYKNAMGLQLAGSWLSGTHAGYPRDVDGYTPTFGANNASVAAAITAYNTANPSYPKTFADIIIFSLGANDIDYGNLTGDAFYANMQTIWNSAVSAGWLDPTYTQVFHVENVNNSHPNIVSRYKTGWTGYTSMAAFNERYTLISSQGAETISSTDLHYTCEQLQTFGKTIAQKAIAGSSSQSAIRKNTYIEKLSPQLGETLDMNTFGISNLGVNLDLNTKRVINTSGITLNTGSTIVSSMTPTGGDDTVLVIDTTNSFALLDIVTSFRNAGVKILDLYGEGSAVFSKPDGSARFSIGAFGTYTTFYEPILYNASVTQHESQVADGASAIGFKYKTAAFTNTGSKAASWNKGSTEILSINGVDGAIQGTPLPALPLIGNLPLRPHPSNQSEKFNFSTVSNVGYLEYHPETTASGGAFRITNYKTNTATPAIQITSQANLTSSNIVEFVNNNSTIKSSINGYGAPGFWAKTPVTTQPTAASGSAGTFTAVGGANAQALSTWTGGLGSTAYTINDIVFALKAAGLVVT